MSAALQLQPSHPVFHPDFDITINTGHEEMWLALRNLPSRNAFTASDLAHVSGATVHAAEHYLGLLVKQDIATRCGFTSERKAIFAVPKLFKEPVVLDAKGHPSRDYAIRRAAWTVMRMRSQFTIADLHDAVSEHITCARKQISAFVTHLEEAGYLTALYAEGVYPKDEYRLRPARNTGPLPPRLCATSLVYDLNRRAFYGTALAREVTL